MNASTEHRHSRAGIAILSAVLIVAALQLATFAYVRVKYPAHNGWHLVLSPPAEWGFGDGYDDGSIVGNQRTGMVMHAYGVFTVSKGTPGFIADGRKIY